MALEREDENTKPRQPPISSIYSCPHPHEPIPEAPTSWLWGRKGSKMLRCANLWHSRPQVNTEPTQPGVQTTCVSAEGTKTRHLFLNVPIPISDHELKGNKKPWMTHISPFNLRTRSNTERKPTACLKFSSLGAWSPWIPGGEVHRNSSSSYFITLSYHYVFLVHCGLWTLLL